MPEVFIFYLDIGGVADDRKFEPELVFMGSNSCANILRFANVNRTIAHVVKDVYTRRRPARIRHRIKGRARARAEADRDRGLACRSCGAASHWTSVFDYSAPPASPSRLT